MTYEKMTVICNIQAMEKHLFYSHTFEDLEKMDLDDLRSLQNKTIKLYNNALK